jgi:hypothetical protein
VPARGLLALPGPRADHHPTHRLKKGRRFTTVVRYDDVPRTQIDLSVPDEPLPYGWIQTDDGAVVVSEPEGSANWFPLNDHPTDKAAFTFVVTVPVGLEAISNGRLVGRRTHDHRTTWVWDAPDQMAPYLATATIGQFDLRSYRTAQGLRTYDAVYVRGAMTLQALRTQVGDRDFFRILRAGRPGRPVVTAPPASSSRWPSGSRASSWMTCSTCGCSPPANPPRPRRQARPPLFLGPRRASRGRRRQRPACSSACRTERHTWGDNRECAPRLRWLPRTVEVTTRRLAGTSTFHSRCRSPGTRDTTFPGSPSQGASGGCAACTAPNGSCLGDPMTRRLPLKGGCLVARQCASSAELSRYARRASSSRTGWAMPCSCTCSSSTKVTPWGARSATRSLTRTRLALAWAAIRAARFTVRPK